MKSSANPQSSLVSSKRTEKASSEATKNTNELFFAFIIEQLDAITPTHWEHFLKEGISFLPTNRVSNQRYTRLNQLILSLDMLINQRSSCFYATFNQISQANGKLKKGSKSIPIQYFSYDIKHLENQTRITIQEYQKLSDNDKKAYACKSFMKLYRVFSMDAIDNLSECNFDVLEQKFDEVATNERAELFINDLIVSKGLILNHSFQKEAFYTPIKDQIFLPNMDLFKDTSSYYSTLFHEIIHWTGHKNRLNRFDEIFEDGRNKYAFEELIAELGSLLFSLDFNYDEQFLNSIVYLKGWLKHTEPSKHLATLEEAFKAANKAISFVKA